MQVGSLAPDFTLIDQNGHAHVLSNYRGQWVFLYFYPQDDTPLCTTEACSVRDNWAAFERQGVKVFGISPDSVESHALFQNKYHLPFTLLADPDKTVMTQYEAWGEKNLYGRLVTGVRRSSVLIDPTGHIAFWYPRVHVKKHVAKVLSDLATAQSDH